MQRGENSHVRIMSKYVDIQCYKYKTWPRHILNMAILCFKTWENILFKCYKTEIWRVYYSMRGKLPWSKYINICNIQSILIKGISNDCLFLSWRLCFPQAVVSFDNIQLECGGRGRGGPNLRRNHDLITVIILCFKRK